MMAERAIPTTSDDVPRGTSAAERAVDYAGWSLTRSQRDQLFAYGRWLVEEAIPAGGLGPREADRVWTRHIGDSLTFAVAWDEQPDEILDVGTGVGLPGIPLAILFPDTMVTLLDRGGRRIRLLHRAARMLELGNVVIAQGDAFAVADEWGGLAFRGSISPPEAIGLTNRLLIPDSRAVLGLSRRPERPERADDLVALSAALGIAAEVREVPHEVLDGPSWLLIMRT
jgi:16S rRNA G527 N7-methylase RsmG